MKQIAAAVLSAFVLSTSANAAQRHCPEMANLPLPDEDVMFVQCFELGAGRAAVIATGSDGPSRGLAYLVDSHGKLGSPVSIGRPRSLSIVELQSGRKLAQIRGVIGSGTGTREEKLEIFDLRYGGLVKIWEGLAYRHDAAGTREDRFESISHGAVTISEITAAKIAIDYVRLEEKPSKIDHKLTDSPKLYFKRRYVVDLP